MIDQLRDERGRNKFILYGIYQGELGCSPLTVVTLDLIQTSSLLG